MYSRTCNARPYNTFPKFYTLTDRQTKIHKDKAIRNSVFYAPAASKERGEIDIEKDHARAEGNRRACREKIAKRKAQNGHSRSSAAASVATAFHGGRKLLGASELRDQKRNEDGNERLCLVDDVSRIEIRATRLLGVDDLLRFLQKRGDEAQSHRHHHGEGMDGNTDLRKGRQQSFNAVRQRDRGGGIHQDHGGRCHQQNDADRHRDRADQTLACDRKGPPRPENRRSVAPEYVDQRREDQNEEKRLQASQNDAEGNPGNRNDQNRKQKDKDIGRCAFCQKDQNDIKNRKQMLAILSFS